MGYYGYFLVVPMSMPSALGTFLATDSNAILNYSVNNASPCLMPIVSGNSSDASSPLKLTLLFESRARCVHARTD